MQGHTGWVLSVALTLDGSQVVSGSDDATIKIWSMSTGALLNTLKASDPGPACLQIESHIRMHQLIGAIYG